MDKDIEPDEECKISAQEIFMYEYFFGPRPITEYYMYYSRTADRQPMPDFIDRPLSGADKENCVIKRKVQNHCVVYNIDDHKIYTYTELSPEQIHKGQKSGAGWSDVEVVGKVDLSKVVLLEDTHGLRSDFEIELDMDLLDLDFEEKQRVRDQIGYAVFSEEAYMSGNHKGDQPYCVVVDATSGKSHTVTSLQRIKPAEKRLGSGTGVKILGRIYYSKTIPIENEYGPINPDEIEQVMKWLRLSKEEKISVRLIEEKHIARIARKNPIIEKMNQIIENRSNIQAGFSLLSNLSL